MRARRGWGDEEKLDQMTETASRSARGSASSAYVGKRRAEKDWPSVRP